MIIFKFDFKISSQTFNCSKFQKCPSGLLTAESLASIYSDFFLYGDCTLLAKHLFSAIVYYYMKTYSPLEAEDPDSWLEVAQINFKQFLVSLCVLLKGSIEERIRWIFLFYDLNKDGIITSDVSELFSLVSV